MAEAAFQIRISAVIGIYPLVVRHELLTETDCMRSMAALICRGVINTKNLLKSVIFSYILDGWVVLKMKEV